MTTIPLPADYAPYAWVATEVLVAQGDTSLDVDRDPEARPAIGYVRLTPLDWGRETASSFVIHEPIVCEINADGVMCDPAGAANVKLWTGPWRADFYVSDAKISPREFVLTAAHTEAAPLHLSTVTAVAPVVPLSGPGATIMRGERGPSGDHLFPVVADTTPPDGASAGELIGYWNRAATTVTVGPIGIEPNAFAILAWDGTEWQAMVGGVPPVPPTWAVGTTATTGTPGSDSVTVTFSHPTPVGQLQVRYGTGGAWQDISATTDTTVILTGLTPAATYAAPEFRVTNTAGETAVVSAQGFTTGLPASVAVLDTFSRTTDSPTTLGTANPTGQTWTADAGTWGTNTGAAYTSVSSSLATSTIDSGLADCDITWTIASNAPTSAGPVRAIFRMTDTSNYLQLVSGTDPVGPVVRWILGKRVAGTVSILTYGTSGVPAAGDVIRVRCEGPTVTVWVNGVQVSTASTTDNQTATRHGMVIHTSTQRWVDEFRVDAL